MKEKCAVKGCDNDATQIMLSHNPNDHERPICEQCIDKYQLPQYIPQYLERMRNLSATRSVQQANTVRPTVSCLIFKWLKNLIKGE